MANWQRIHQKGFTLIEVMVVVVILSILVSIALPTYTEYVNKGRRSDAMAELMNAAQVQEQFILDRNTYSATVAGLGIDATSNEGHYTISVDAETTSCPITRCYSLTATAVGAQANDTQCASFTLTSAGIKTATDSVGNSANDCWSR